MTTNWRNKYPLNTFTGETRAELERLIEDKLQKAREGLLQEIYDEFNWLNTNNAIPDSELVKGDLHWEMLQKISSDTRRELQARLIKIATQHNVKLDAYHHQSELDQSTTAQARVTLEVENHGAGTATSWKDDQPNK